MGRFLTAIASLPRIITPVELELETFEGDLVRSEMVAPVSARFTIQTYVLGGTGPMPPAEGAGEGA